MKKYFITVVAILQILLFESPLVIAHELSGNISLESLYYFHEPLFTDQKKHAVSLSVEQEYYHELENETRLTITPFGRFDSADSERTHFDLRELHWMYVRDSWEVLIGFGKVFWGVTEFVHLVDIINQTDYVENINSESKLGQPMLKFSFSKSTQSIDFFVLPGFRERTYPGTEGRFRPSVVIDADSAEYESSAEQTHVDFALRYFKTINEIEFGIYHFTGTGREPELQFSLDPAGQPTLIPYYIQIAQTGLDFQWTIGQWLLKTEALYRTGQGDSFFAGVGGFEYTFINFADSGIDIGIISEYAYDERGEQATVAYQRDVMGGLRLAVNDMASSEILAGISYDLQNSSTIITIEASRRIGNSLRLNLESGHYLINEDDITYDLRDDDFIKLGVVYYFDLL